MDNQNQLPTQPDPSRSNKTLPLLLTVIAIGVLTVLTASLISSSKLSQQSQNRTVAIHPAISLAPNGVGENWKIYKSEKARYSILYPPTYTVRVRDDLIYTGGPAIEIYPASTNPQSPEYIISIAVDKNMKNLTLDNPRLLFGIGPLIQYEVLPDNVQVLDVSLGGVKAVHVDHCCGGYNGIEMEIKTIKNNMIYEIIVAPDSMINKSLNNLQKRQTVNQILSTFKFLDQD